MLVRVDRQVRACKRVRDDRWVRACKQVRACRNLRAYNLVLWIRVEIYLAIMFVKFFVHKKFGFYILNTSVGFFGEL